MRSKHIHMRLHFIRQMIEDEEVEVSKVASKLNPADLFTKPLKRARMEDLFMIISFEDLKWIQAQIVKAKEMLISRDSLPIWSIDGLKNTETQLWKQVLLFHWIAPSILHHLQWFEAWQVADIYTKP